MMKWELDPATAATPEPPEAETAAASVSSVELADASQARGLTAHYILVEDIDYLTRTGKSRQVLAIRWKC